MRERQPAHWILAGLLLASAGLNVYLWRSRDGAAAEPAPPPAANGTAPRPSQDPVTGDPLKLHTLDLLMADPDAVSGMEVLEGVLARFHESGAVARCAAQHPAEGTLSLKLTIQNDPRGVQLDAGGSLAVHAVGSCLTAALKSVIAATPTPAKVMSAAKFSQITLPLPK